LGADDNNTTSATREQRSDGDIGVSLLIRSFFIFFRNMNTVSIDGQRLQCRWEYEHK